MKEAVMMPDQYTQIDLMKVKKKQRRTRFIKGMLFLLPSIILFSVFLFYPMARTLYLSFFLTDNSGATTVFVGFDNFKNIFTSPIFLKKLTINVFVCFIYSARHDFD